MSAVFIGFCISFLPMVIFPTVVALNVNSMTLFTLLLDHKCTNDPFSSDHYSNVLHD